MDCVSPSCDPDPGDRDQTEGVRHQGLEIYRAAGEDDLTSLDALLNEPADPERQAFVNMSLVRTCAMEHSKCPELLLQHGANPNTIILGGGELIRQAASDGLPTALLVAWFEYCCQMPGEPVPISLDGELFRYEILSQNTLPLPLKEAVENLSVKDCKESVRLLRSTFASSRGQIETPLSLAAEAGCVSTVEALLAAGADITRSGANGRTPLHVSVFSCRVGVARLLLQAGADAGQKDDEDASPLSLACLKQDSGMLRLLLDSLAPSHLDAPDQYGETLLFDLLRGPHDHYHCLAHLLARGMNPDHRNHRGFTPLMLAVLYSKVRVVALFLQHNCRTDGAGQYYCRQTNRRETHTPLQAALVAQQGHLVHMLEVAACMLRLEVDGLTDGSRLLASLPQSHRTWLSARLTIPISLKAVCRLSLRHHLGSRFFCTRLQALPLPQLLRSYLMLPEIDALLGSNTTGLAEGNVRGSALPDNTHVNNNSTAYNQNMPGRRLCGHVALGKGQRIWTNNEKKIDKTGPCVCRG